MFLQTTHMLKLYISLSCNYAVAFGYVFYFILGQICLYALVRFRHINHLVRALCFGLTYLLKKTAGVFLNVPF